MPCAGMRFPQGNRAIEWSLILLSFRRLKFVTATSPLEKLMYKSVYTGKSGLR